MVVKKISELTTITDTTPSADVLAIVSGNATNKITVNNLINSAGDITITGKMQATSLTGSLAASNIDQPFTILEASSTVTFSNLPTSDPSNAGQLWRSGSAGNEVYLMVSLG